MTVAASNKWLISSNDGRASIEFEFLANHQIPAVIEFCVTLSDKHWDQNGLNVNEYNEVDKCRLELFQVMVPLSECMELLKNFERWLNSFIHFTHTLCSDPGTELVVQIGQREDYIYDPEKPTLTFYFRQGSFCTEFYFVVDQSCIRIARDRLTFLLESVQEIESSSHA